MTGINHGRSSTPPTCEEAYKCAKQAAERFQILQVGLTSVWYDETISSHKTLSFSIPITPLFLEKGFQEFLVRELDRTLAFSANALSFLRINEFNVEKALSNGVTHMSRHDERRALEGINSDYGNIDVATLEECSRDIYNAARQDITKWKNERQPTALRLRSPYGDKLTSLQSKLIRQLVRVELPGLAVKYNPNKPEILEIFKVTPAQEIIKKSKDEIKVREIQKLVGVRYIFEALAGGDFAEHIDASTIKASNTPPGTTGWETFNKSFNLADCGARLKQYRPILIGHNLFHDMVSIYHTFFEPLPDTLEEFRMSLSQLFPRIADTKYQFTRQKHLMAPGRNLSELFSLALEQQFPIVLSEGPFGYADKRWNLHDAGFDGWMTSVVFLRQTYDPFSQKVHTIPIDEMVFAQRNSANLAVRPHSSSGYRNPEQRSLMDEDGNEEPTLDSLRHLRVLRPQALRKRPGRDVVMPLEIYSSKELANVPLWDDTFWQTFGNRTCLHGGGTLCFD